MDKKENKNKQKTPEQGVMWSFKRILAVGIIVMAIGLIALPGAAQDASRRGSGLSFELNSGRAAREQREAVATFWTIFTLIGAGIIVTAFVYKTVKLNKISEKKKTTKGDSLDEISKLKKLLDDGAIDKEEYEQKKQELLKKI